MTERFLRLNDVKLATGLGGSTIYRLVAENRFPKQVKVIGPGTAAWLASEVDAWMQKRIEVRDGKRGKAV